jgi:hypothetical protein
LAANRPAGVHEDEMNRAVELAKYADKAKLTAADKQAVLGYLK